MIEDMTMRNFAPRTQEGYIRAVRAFAGFLGRTPSAASFEDVRRFQRLAIAAAALLRWSSRRLSPSRAPRRPRRSK
jgi:integrase/recombinase XerD